MVLNSKEITAPEPKIETVDIPGADGVLDLTEYFGEVKYRNRKLTFEFATICSGVQFWDLFSDIQNKIHGQRLKIALSEDFEYYYIGRITVDKWLADKNIGKITVSCDCEPYKYKNDITSRTDDVISSASLTYCNLKKSVRPTFRLSAPATLIFDGKEIQAIIPNAEFVSSDIVFKEGANNLVVIGDTSITCSYQERGL